MNASFFIEATADPCQLPLPRPSAHTITQKHFQTVVTKRTTKCVCFYSSFTENLRTAEEKQNNLEFLQLLKLGGIKYAKPLKKQI